MRNKRVTLILAIVMLFVAVCVPLEALAVEQEMALNSEMVEQRTPNSKTYDLGDGQIMMQIFSEDVHYISPDGTYQEIDTQPMMIQEGSDYQYYNTTNSVHTYHSRNLNASNVIRLEKGTHSISVAPNIGISEAIEATKASDFTAKAGVVEDISAAFFSTSTDIVTYSSADSQVAFCSEIIPGGAINSIISAAPMEVYTFFLIAQDLSLKDDNGRWYFADNKGKPVFDISDCSIMDANGNYADISVDMRQSGNGYILQLSQSPNDAKLPGAVKASVTITLSSINTIDTYVSSKTPTKSYGSEPVLKVGSNVTDAICRSYLKFQLPDRFWRYAITGASLRLMKNSGATPSMKAYSLTQSFSNSTTWNTAPSYSTTYASGNATVYSGNWWQMDVTNIVRAWSREDQAHNGFLVRAITENGNLTEFVSSNGASSYKPILNIIAKPIDRTFQIKGLCGPNVTSAFVSNQLGSAKGLFLEKFAVTFNTPLITSSSSLAETSGCTLSPNYCTAACGAVGSCSTLHHKSGGRLLTTAADGSYNTVVRYVWLKLCYYDGQHKNINGLSHVGTYSSTAKNTLISTVPSSVLNVTLHELTHALGGSHCNNSSCIMYPTSSGSTTWCSSCLKNIRIMLQQTS